jgi:16S rRNA (cytosine967-C5)-methyltransferase
MASAGATVIATDLHPKRASLVAANGLATVVVADARRPPFPRQSFDRVLVDAPCSGLGALRRRADARWRIEPDDVDHLVALQRELVDAAVALVRPGGVLVYSVCTLTKAESLGIDDHLASQHPQLVPLEPPGEPWQPWGRGGLLLPQTAGTDGMTILRLRSPADG